MVEFEVEEIMTVSPTDTSSAATSQETSSGSGGSELPDDVFH